MRVIEPIKGSSALFGQKNNRDFNRVEAQVVSWTSTTNQDTLETGDFDLGGYRHERFPDSRQNWRPEYNIGLRQFDIRHPDGKLWTQEDATDCLKRFPLSYPEDWHNQNDAGKPITRCDIGNMDDAYFNHKAWVTIGEEGRVEVGDSPWDDVLLAMYSGNTGVKADDGSPYRPGDIRYRIKNPDMDAKREENKVEGALDAMELYRAMAEDNVKMADILVMLGSRVTKNDSRVKLQKALLPYVMDVTTEGGTPRQELFRKYAKLDPDELKFQALVMRACRVGVINEGAGVYKFREAIVGRSFSEAVLFFKDLKNNQSLEILKKDLDDSDRGTA